MYPTTYHSRTRRTATLRTWLAAGGGLAAVLVLLILAMAACSARSDQNDPVAGIVDGTATPTTTPDDDGGPASGVGTGGENQSGGNPDNGNDGGNDNGNDGGNDGGDDGSEDTEEEPDQPEPPAPLTIDVSVHTITPGGNCFAAGTIAVTGGSYPLTVHYQWRRLVLGGGWDGDPVSAVQNVTLDGPGEVQVQTDGLPEDGTNVMLLVTGPKDAGSGLVTYDGCSDQPGDIGTGG